MIGNGDRDGLFPCECLVPLLFFFRNGGTRTTSLCCKCLFRGRCVQENAGRDMSSLCFCLPSVSLDLCLEGDRLDLLLSLFFSYSDHASLTFGDPLIEIPVLLPSSPFPVTKKTGLGLSTSRSRVEKCFSRVFCSRCRVTRQPAVFADQMSRAA